MKRALLLTSLALITAAITATFLGAQRYVRQNEKIEYAFTVEGQKPGDVKLWWDTFRTQHSIDGTYFDVYTQPVFARPQIGDKAAVLKVGGVGQLVQIVEIPPGGKTKWHGYGWEGESLFFIVQGRGQTEYRSPGGLPTSKYSWKKNTLFAIPVDHEMQHVNTDPNVPVRMVVVVGYAINMYPYVEEELRRGVQNPAENPEERARTLSRTTYPGHYVEDLRDHPVAMREARGNKTAFFNTMATAGHRTHPNVHISELTGPVAYAHKHGNQPIFIILKGAGYDYWSEAADLKAFEAAVKSGKVHKQEYKEGTLCGVPAGPHWHQHYSTHPTEPLRYLAIVPRGEYEENPSK